MNGNRLDIPDIIAHLMFDLLQYSCRNKLTCTVMEISLLQGAPLDGAKLQRKYLVLSKSKTMRGGTHLS